MTIDRDAFATGMGVLAGAYGRIVDAAVVRAYYHVLSPTLTTEEFGRVVERAIASQEYWPSPAVLLRLAGRSSGETAAVAFEHLRELLRTYHGHLFVPHAEYQALSPAAKEGLRAIGGFRALANVTEDRFPALERRFTYAYAETAYQRLVKAGDVKLLA